MAMKYFIACKKFLMVLGLITYLKKTLYTFRTQYQELCFIKKGSKFLMVLGLFYYYTKSIILFYKKTSGIYFDLNLAFFSRFYFMKFMREIFVFPKMTFGVITFFLHFLI
jgi:hypothetical protein